MIALVGKTSSGKTTIRDELLGIRYEPVITYTTRPIRPGEKDGVDYHFVDDKTFRNMITEGEFVEFTDYTLANGTKVYYGTTYESIEKNNQNKVIILNPDGLKSFKEENIDMIVFYLKCNENTIAARLISRGDDPAEAERRLSADKEDFKDISDLTDYELSNDKGVPAKRMCYIIDQIYKETMRNRKDDSV